MKQLTSWSDITKQKTAFNEGSKNPTAFSEGSKQKTTFSEITKQNTDFDAEDEATASTESIITYGDSNTLYGEGDCRYGGQKLTITWPAGRKKTAWVE